MRAEPKYVVHASHGLTCTRLMQAYGLKPGECLLVPLHRRAEDVTRGYANREGMIHLWGEADYRFWRIRRAGLDDAARRRLIAVVQAAQDAGIPFSERAALEMYARAEHFRALLNGGG